jgi:hypothetical protein
LNIFYQSRLWAVIWLYILLIYLSLPLMRVVLDSLKESVGREVIGWTLNGLLLASGLALLVLGARLSRRTLVHIAIPLAAIFVLASQLSIPEERFHFLEYGLLGALVLKTARLENLSQLLLMAVFVVLVGIGDELIQWALPNRVGDLRDVGMNTMAGVLGVWIGKSLFWASARS